MNGDLSGDLDRARAAVRNWEASKPRTVGRDRAASVAIEAYAMVDAAMILGHKLPDQWATAIAVPSVEEVAEALSAVGLMMPIHEARVMDIARKVVEVMTYRRQPPIQNGEDDAPSRGYSPT